MFQSLTRAVPSTQNVELFDWLRRLYPIWSRMTPEMVRIATKTAIAELIMSGCTTTSDHLYIFPNGVRLEDSIEAAHEMGMRFHATRGAMSVGESQGGLPPDLLVEDEAHILSDTQALIERWHNPAPHSMLQIAVAPCSPFSVSQSLMRESALLARNYGVGLHTHLAENESDIDYCREIFRKTPAQYVEDLGWTGQDVWHAHCVKLDKAGIDSFAQTGTCVCHCPSSNMRLGSGIAPIPAMKKQSVTVSLGVDGSASNDSGHLLAEARQALLLARAGFGPAALTARDALKMATLGGATTLGRTDIGRLAKGASADVIAFKLGQLPFAGALHDPVAALIFCAPQQVTHSLINGRMIVKDGLFTRCDIHSLTIKHNQLATELLNNA